MNKHLWTCIIILAIIAVLIPICTLIPSCIKNSPPKDITLANLLSKVENEEWICIQIGDETKYLGPRLLYLTSNYDNYIVTDVYAYDSYSELIDDYIYAINIVIKEK